ncbi:MAG: hypothetical protein ACJA13_001677 [Paraglaciecola sp.]|jgi:hypothetical protein
MSTCVSGRCYGPGINTVTTGKMKKNQRSTSSFFWVKHVFLAMAVIAIAVFVIVLQYMNATAPIPEGGKGPKSISQNVSDFYANYRLSSRYPAEENIGDFVNVVKVSDKPLAQRLKKMESLQKPLSPNWAGDHKHRSFKAGTTLRGAITDYAQSEGIQLIWELDRDFIVKHDFQIDNSVIGSLSSIARAIDSNFEGTVRAYVCSKQRSLVITNTKSAYLRENCSEAGTNGS